MLAIHFNPHPTEYFLCKRTTPTKNTQTTTPNPQKRHTSPATLSKRAGNGGNTTNPQNTAQNATTTQNRRANNSEYQPHHQNRPSVHQNRQNARPNAQSAGGQTSLATAPHAPNQRQKANLARLPDPYSFYSRYLTVKGGGLWRLAVCPFHDDTRPSLSLNMQHGGYICHTCGAKSVLYEPL
ncbi:CHC2 zinc finger domain-containing protein [Moraxella caprae]|nr:CHC2 zinc finger domain-containing protein [Moraxella caprae]